MTTDPQYHAFLDAADAIRPIVKPKSTNMWKKQFSPRRMARRIQISKVWWQYERKNKRQQIHTTCGYHLPVTTFTNKDVGMGPEKQWDYQKRQYVKKPAPTKYRWHAEDALTPDGRPYGPVDVAHAFAHQISQSPEHNGAFAKAFKDILESQAGHQDRMKRIRDAIVAIYKDHDVVYRVNGKINPNVKGKVDYENLAPVAQDELQKMIERLS